MSDIALIPFSSQFFEACAAYELVYGHKPYKAVISKQSYEQLVRECGPLFYRGPRAELGLEFNGVKLEVVGE